MAPVKFALFAALLTSGSAFTPASKPAFSTKLASECLVSNVVANSASNSSYGFESTTAQQQQLNNHNKPTKNNVVLLRASTNNNPKIRSITDHPSSSSQQPSYMLHRDLVIGKGTYAQVCIASRRARDQTIQHSFSGKKRRKFACKCVALRNENPYHIDKLQEEVNVLRELRGHQNVIELYDVFSDENELYIITELGRGGNLFHLLTTHHKHGITEACAAKMASEMLSAVAFLHSRHVCHRDLKLENWVLESEKDICSPLKLIDFGLCTHYTPGQRLSRTVGSSSYVAPEVLNNSYTEKCDIWSVGVVVYMLLSGTPPFWGENDDATKAAIMKGEYSFPPKIFRDVSNEAMDFISALLSYNAEDRSTALQALSHPWLASKLDCEQLERCMNVVGVNTGGDNYQGLRP